MLPSALIFTLMSRIGRNPSSPGVSSSNRIVGCFCSDILAFPARIVCSVQLCQHPQCIWQRRLAKFAALCRWIASKSGLSKWLRAFHWVDYPLRGPGFVWMYSCRIWRRCCPGGDATVPMHLMLTGRRDTCCICSCTRVWSEWPLLCRCWYNSDTTSKEIGIMFWRRWRSAWGAFSKCSMSSDVLFTWADTLVKSGFRSCGKNHPS